MPRIVYVAGPYTSRATGRATRYHEQALRAKVLTRYAAELMQREGCAVLSPVTHGHAIWTAGGCEADPGFEAWLAINRAMMDAANELHVVRLAGWEYSAGVAFELADFERRGIDPKWVDLPRLFYANEHEIRACHRGVLDRV